MELYDVILGVIIILLILLVLRAKKEYIRVGSPFDFSPGTFRIGSYDPNDYPSEMVNN